MTSDGKDDTALAQRPQLAGCRTKHKHLLLDERKSRLDSEPGLLKGWLLTKHKLLKVMEPEAYYYYFFLFSKF